ncbi:MAG: class I SAM-dependent methyltransferase [Candidatus Coatesbacteria bacterium]
MTGGIYDHALACDVAFAFRDLRREVDGIEACIREHSRIPVRTVLDVGCGTGPHLPELARRGYAYTGLDSGPAMLDFGRRRAAALGLTTAFLEGDLAGFAMPGPFDFAFIAMNSLYVRDLAGVAGNLASVAGVLRPGGLYLLDWCIQNVELRPGEHRWEVARDGVRVRAAVAWTNVDEPERTFDETVVFEIDDHGRAETIRGVSRRRAVYPDEFLALVRESGSFELVGWWDEWNLGRPLARLDAATRLQVALRRTGG